MILEGSRPSVQVGMYRMAMSDSKGTCTLVIVSALYYLVP